MSEKITAREFLTKYTASSNITPEQFFAEGLVVATCTHCDYEACQGWQATTPFILERYGRGDTLALDLEEWRKE